MRPRSAAAASSRRQRRSTRRSNRRLRRIAILLGASTVLLGTFVLRHPSDDLVVTAVNDVAQLLAASWGAAGSGIVALRSEGRVRRGWGAMSGGCAAWAVGQAGWTVYEVLLRVEVPSPGWVDVGFIAAPVLWILGVLTFIDTPAGRRSQVAGLLEGLMLAGGLFLAAWNLVLAPVTQSAEGTWAQQAVTLSYPILDVCVLATVLFALSRRAMTGSLPIVTAGLLAISIADGGFWYLTSAGTYTGTNVCDLGWILGFCLVGLGALHRPTAETQSGGRMGAIWRRLSIPHVLYCFGVMATVGSIARPDGPTFGMFERLSMMTVAVIGLSHRLATLAETRSLTVGLEARVRERTEEIGARERYFATLVRSSSDIVTVVDRDRTVRSVSPSLMSIYGLVPEDFVGRPISLVPEVDAAVDRVEDEPDRVQRFEWRIVDANGRERIAESTVSNLVADVDIAGFVINTRDVTDRSRLEQRLRHQAFHDPLTGLPNRAYFADRAAHALRRAGRNAAQIAIAIVDLDGFKGINDSRGHHAGDRVLQAVADRLGRVLLPNETVARLGGDEFAILVEDLDDSVDPAADPGADPEQVAARLLDAVRVVVDLDGAAYEVRASVGLAVSSRAPSHPANAIDELLRAADIAMYNAKRDGRNTARVFEPEMHTSAQQSFDLQAELRGAWDRDEIMLFFQPTFSLATGRISGFEALVRWQHPDHGLLSPDRFIPIAEESGLIVPLGDWVLRSAVAQLASWSAEFGADDLEMAINVSVGQLGSDHVLRSLQAAIDETGIDPSLIILEITESILITDTDAVVCLLHRIAALGVRIAIDDFGTGYASLTNLRSLPVSVLKIDRSFVSGDARDDGVLLSTILHIAHALGLETIGEGIETADQLELLRDGGCDIGQGYYLSRPLADDAVRECLSTRNAALRTGRSSELPIGRVERPSCAGMLQPSAEYSRRSAPLAR